VVEEEASLFSAPSKSGASAVAQLVIAPLSGWTKQSNGDVPSGKGTPPPLLLLFLEEEAFEEAAADEGDQRDTHQRAKASV